MQMTTRFAGLRPLFIRCPLFPESAQPQSATIWACHPNPAPTIMAHGIICQASRNDHAQRYDDGLRHDARHVMLGHQLTGCCGKTDATE